MRIILTSIIAVCFSISSIATAQKQEIHKRDDLPRHIYRIDVKAVDLCGDEEAVLQLAREVRTDLEEDLEKFEIRDSTTLQEFYERLGIIAILEQRWDDYQAYLEKRRQLEDKEALRLAMDLAEEAIVAAHRSAGPDIAGTAASRLRERLAALPYEPIEAGLKAAKGRSEILSPGFVQGRLDAREQPVLDQSGGEMSLDIAASLLKAAYTLQYYIPVKDALREVIADVIKANRVVKPDIWDARDVEIRPGQGRGPVTIAVWDSGVDTSVFCDENLLWVNGKEIPDNGIDDDSNGFVDDVNGIAFSLHAEKEPDLLLPIGELGDAAEGLQGRMKGLLDIQAAVESDDATELKQTISSLKRNEVQPLIESVNLYANYAHGTHVAGVAVRGNPYARLLVARITFDHRLMPETPTLVQARKDALAITEAIDYFKKNGVRVVNMSWGASLSMIESALEKNAAGGSPDERKVLARKLFSTVDEAFRKAIREAPEILFVTSAGNLNNDVRFDELLPSSYDYPNVLTVGAVDQAGDETSFTSFGKVELYANGFEVLSYVPGGDQLKINGTSQSAPQVANLAGKLLALNPDLAVADLRRLILEGCDEKKAGDRTVRLLNPKRSVSLLGSLLSGVQNPEGTRKTGDSG